MRSLALSATVEVLARYRSGVYDCRWWISVGVVVAIVFALPWTRGMLARLPGRATSIITVVGICILGFAWAWHLRWLCDDAYISFRYSKNLAGGHGLVFNPGERVEGYSNFLWTAILGGGIRLHLDPGQLSIVLGLGSFVGTLALTQRVARRLAPAGAPVVLSISTVLLAASYIFASFATSGLETMFCSFLVLLAVERAMAGAPMSSGTAGIAAVMSHPDHALLYAALGGALLLDRARRRDILRYAAPFVLVYVPYFLIRWHYYGDLFPNTYYAKSADRTYFSQGLSYLAISGLGAGIWAALPLVVYGAIRNRRDLIVRYLLIALPIYFFYVAKIGGDFMFGRLLCPVLPPILLVAELGARYLIVSRRTLVAIPAVAMLTAVALPVKMLKPWEKRWHLADERTFYQLKSFSPIRVDSIYFNWGQSLFRHFTQHGSLPKMALGCVGMVGYYSELPIVDTFGLNDRVVARQPIVFRGRPGHEKLAPPDYVISRRDVDVSDGDVYPYPYAQVARLMIDGTSFQIVHYRPAIIEALRGQPGVAFQDFKEYLDRYLTQPAPSREQAESDFAFFTEYYFSVTDDPQRLARLEKYVQNSKPLRTDRRVLFDFEEREFPGWSTTGGAFEFGSTPALNPNQQPIRGSMGVRVANSYHRYLFDDAMGVIVSPQFTIDRAHLGLKVGGGAAPSTRVELRVDGVPIYQASGINSEQMIDVVWDVARFEGKQGQIAIVDLSRGIWGHIVVDQIELFNEDATPAALPPLGRQRTHPSSGFAKGRTRASTTVAKHDSLRRGGGVRRE